MLRERISVLCVALTIVAQVQAVAVHIGAQDPTTEVPSPPPTTIMPGPPKPQWAWVFDAPFGLNIKSSNYTNVSSHFYYDWSYRHSSKITYPDQCLPEITTNPCDLTFNDNGTFLFTQQTPALPFKPGNIQCCLLFPGVGSLPPDFLAPFNYTGVESVPNMYGANVSCDKWHNFGFAYWTSAADGSDIQVRDGPGDTFWNYGTLNFPSTLPYWLFDIPVDCTDLCLLSETLDEGIRHRIRTTLKPHHLGPFAKWW